MNSLVLIRPLLCRDAIRAAPALTPNSEGTVVMKGSPWNGTSLTLGNILALGRELYFLAAFERMASQMTAIISASEAFFIFERLLLSCCLWLSSWEGKDWAACIAALNPSCSPREGRGTAGCSVGGSQTQWELMLASSPWVSKGQRDPFSLLVIILLYYLLLLYSP